MMLDVKNLWDLAFMWETFGFILKIVAPFLMIIIAIIGVGMLLQMVVAAVKRGADK
mgnify:CR=1 FL=1